MDCCWESLKKRRSSCASSQPPDMSLPPLMQPSGFNAHPPLPPGLTYQVHFTRTEGRLPSTSGRGSLWYAIFWPIGRPLKGLVLFCHGLHEHSERYHHVLAQLAARGYAAAAHDHLGHGRSDGRRGDVERFDEFVDDAEAFGQLVRSQIRGPVPTFVWGQSMGGLIAAHVALRDSRRGPKANLSGAIVSSGAMDIHKTPIIAVQETLSPLLVMMMPKARIVPAVRSEEMSSAPAEVQRMVNDPLCTVELKVRVQLAVEVNNAMNAMATHGKELTTPLLVLHGTDDKCTYMPGAERLVNGASSADKEFVAIQGGWHCLFHEPTLTPMVVGRLLAFLDRVSSGQVVSSPPSKL